MLSKIGDLERNIVRENDNALKNKLSNITNLYEGASRPSLQIRTILEQFISILSLRGRPMVATAIAFTSDPALQKALLHRLHGKDVLFFGALLAHIIYILFNSNI